MSNIDETWKDVLEKEEWYEDIEQEVDRLKNDLGAQVEKLRKASYNRPTEREVVLARQVKDLTKRLIR